MTLGGKHTPEFRMTMAFGSLWLVALTDLEYSRAPMKNRRAVITKLGGPEVPAVIENELPPPERDTGARFRCGLWRRHEAYGSQSWHAQDAVHTRIRFSRRSDRHRAGSVRQLGKNLWVCLSLGPKTRVISAQRRIAAVI